MTLIMHEKCELLACSLSLRLGRGGREWAVHS